MTSISLILAQASSGGGITDFLLPIVLFGIIFYFLLIRPQKKQRQEQEARIASLSKGDKVVTIGGMHGIVHHISKETVTLKISEGVFVPFNKVAIASTDKPLKRDGKKAKNTSENESKEEADEKNEG